METVDFKKDKTLYPTKPAPVLVDVPQLPFITVSGKGDPNAEDGEYRRALQLLYALSYTIKMSKKGDSVPEGYFEYAVAPLEGLWHNSIDYGRKDLFEFTSMIRQPVFVTQAVFEWACGEVRAKKGLDTRGASLSLYTEGLCVQCLHVGPYDEEPATLKKIEAFISENGLRKDVCAERPHHEIYLGDPRRCAPEALKTILRIPVKKA